MASRIARSIIVLCALVCSSAHASIDSLWSSVVTKGNKGALYTYGTNQIGYLYSLDSAASVCRIYDPTSFVQLHSFTLSSSVYTYVYNYYLNDVNSNGHPELIVQNYEYPANSVKIIDVDAGSIIKSWSNPRWSYSISFLGTTPG